VKPLRGAAARTRLILYYSYCVGLPLQSTIAGVKNHSFELKGFIGAADRSEKAGERLLGAVNGGWIRRRLRRQSSRWTSSCPLVFLAMSRNDEGVDVTVHERRSPSPALNFCAMVLDHAVGCIRRNGFGFRRKCPLGFRRACLCGPDAFWDFARSESRDPQHFMAIIAVFALAALGFC